jgi:hypothetical protein
MDPNCAVGAGLTVRWDADTRIAYITSAPDAVFNGEDGAMLVQALTRWTGGDRKPFAILGDASGLRTTDAAYRLETRPFFVKERERVFVAITNLSPIPRVIGEMFRIGTRIQLKGFSTEADARAWLREKGIRA